MANPSHTRLTADARQTPPPPKIYPRVETFADYERSITRGDHRQVSIGLWVEFLQTVFGKVSGGRGRDVQSNYTIDCLETMYFVADPALEETQTCLKAPRIQAVTKASRIPGFRTSVYMVTGLMIAKGFSADMTNNERRNGEVEISGNVPSPVGQFGTGTSIAKSASTEEADKCRAGEDIVFAYQLLKIEVKGWNGQRVEYDELRHKAAYLSENVEQEPDEEEHAVEDVLISPANAGTLPSDHDSGEVVVTEVGEGKGRVSCISSTQKYI
ncbi:hypothetical protein BDV40DRAFT_307033 [Aspergillus tamarii]|uniref:Uncharacterized protein n=1 Tax=Aspergillus tamarii TaxID=41984 RepID=A0A5N6UAE6_ASPTM|nr:hypothetical protein BDV40DRAFT_307033 [Aspergillus tamarii]